MTIGIKNKFAVTTIVLLRKFTWFALILIINLVVVVATVPTDINPTLGVLLLFVAPILFVVYVIADSLMYCSKATVSLKENSLELLSGNLTSTHNSTLTFHQIENLNVVQSFLMKVFGVCQINVFHGELMTSTWGYNYQDAKELVEAFGEKHHIKVK